jgi:hypothetical protein
MMTTSQAPMRQAKWKQRAYRRRCTHLILELEWDEQGYWTGNYVCNFCGKSCSPRDFSHVATRPAPALSTAHCPLIDC